MEKGVLLIAYGADNYAKMAYNMALSIKHYSPNVKVALVDGGCMKKIEHLRPNWRELFDHIQTFTPEKAGQNKVKLDLYSPFEKTLYLDIDGITIKSIEPLLEGCIASGAPMLTQVHGKGGLEDRINYGIWAKNVSAWAWFDIPFDATFQATQTSIVYFDKSQNITGKLFKKMREKFHFPSELLTHNWGNTIPDELIYSGSAAHYGIDLDIRLVTDTHPVFFGNTRAMRFMLKDIEKANYVLSFPGSAAQLKAKYLMFAQSFLDRINRDAFKVKEVFHKKFAG